MLGKYGDILIVLIGTISTKIFIDEARVEYFEYFPQINERPPPPSLIYLGKILVKIRIFTRGNSAPDDFPRVYLLGEIEYFTRGNFHLRGPI